MNFCKRCFECAEFLNVLSLGDNYFSTMWSWAVFWIFILSGSFVAAVALYDLYRRRKKEFDDFEKDLVLVCRLARVSRIIMYDSVVFKGTICS